MAKRPILTTISNILTSATIINSNNNRIEESFDNTLSRDGSTPNQMEADLDMNSNDILNVGSLTVDDLSLNGGDLEGYLSQAETAADQAAASAVSAQASADSINSFDPSVFQPINATLTEISTGQTEGLVALGIEPQLDTAWITGTSIEESVVSPAKIRSAAAEAPGSVINRYYQVDDNDMDLVESIVIPRHQFNYEPLSGEDCAVRVNFDINLFMNSIGEVNNNAPIIDVELVYRGYPLFVRTWEVESDDTTVTTEREKGYGTTSFTQYLTGWTGSRELILNVTNRSGNIDGRILFSQINLEEVRT